MLNLLDWLRRNQKMEDRREIIAVDFDGTLCENKWPEIGASNDKLIAYLKKRREGENGARIILWANRVEDKLEAAINWCKERGLIFDAVNDNLPEIVEKFGSNCRKIFADVYIDDRAGNPFDLPFYETKGGMMGWAEREVDIACKYERGASGTDEGEWDYGCACYESALRAFGSICKDGHSGFSIGLTKQILVRLIEGKPLTPINDTDEEWNDVSHYAEDKPGTKFQCKRMSSLFKDVSEDGTVKYTDTDRCYCKDIHTGSTYNFGIVRKLIDEMYPIKMPYIPEDKPYVVFCEDFLFDGKGDFDTFGILYLRDPKGNTIQINRFFKEAEEDGLIEISKKEYESRRPKKEEQS